MRTFISTLPAGGKTLLGGIGFLVVALGVGRFAYTPLLPLMQDYYGFGDAAGGALASVNYAGYLAGAIGAGFIPARQRLTWFRAALVVSLVSTALMGVMNGMAAWGFLRLAAGIASAVVFVPGTVLALEAMAMQGFSAQAGAMYSGVGIGIALAGIAAAPLSMVVGVDGAWIGLAVLSLLPFTMSLMWITDVETSGGGKKRSVDLVPGAVGDLVRLGFAYLLEGAGYVVSATFLVRILRELPSAAVSGDAAWVIVGVSTAVSAVFWPRLAGRIGHAYTIAVCHIFQAVGIILPVAVGGVVGAYGGAVLFGGTFMGIVGLSLVYARLLAPNRAGPAVGVLTALFGLGQIIAPVAAGYASELSGSFNAPLLFASALVALGGVTLLFNHTGR